MEGRTSHIDMGSIETRASMSDCELVSNNSYSSRIDIDTFRDIYSKEQIERDEQRCEYLKRSYAEKNKVLGKEAVFAATRSDALETIVVNQAEMNNWFGENSFLIRTSEYDDYNNHVDAVLEFAIEGKESQRLALAIDSTSASSRNNDVINRKIERNIEDVKYDRTTVKYFESQVDNFRGRLRTVLPVVVGLDERNSDDLISLSATIIKLEAQKISGNARLAQIKKEMEKHPAQLLFLEEIKQQLEMYHGLEIYKNNNQLLSILETIKEVMGEKAELTGGTQYRNMERGDRTYNQIIDKCQNRLIQK